MIGGIGELNTPTALSEVALENIGTTNGILSDSVLRSEVAKFEMNEAIFDITIERTIDEAKAGNNSGALSSFFKFYGTELNKERYELMLAMNGAEGLAWEGEASDDGRLAKLFLRTKGNSIEGGTSEIQLNIIAKRILGL
jgi:acyl-CoA dehydrogenase